MKPLQLTLDIDEGQPFQEDVRLHDCALSWAGGDFKKAIAWIGRAEDALLKDHGDKTERWERKAADAVAKGHYTDEEAYQANHPKPGMPKAKLKILANAKKLLIQTQAVSS